MKKHFYKQVTERPRAGGGIKAPKGEKRRDQKAGEDQPKREKIRQKWLAHYSGKHFTDVLGPLYNYFHSKVGEKWDDIYSELCENLPKKSLQGLHIHGHIESMVETKVILINKVPCYADGMLYGMPIREDRRGQFYVDPRDGRLCRLLPKKRERYEEEKTQIDVDEYHQYQKIDGIWYEYTLEQPKIVREDKVRCQFTTRTYTHRYYYDPLSRTMLSEGQVFSKYGKLVVCVSKRQLNKKEIKRISA